MAGITHKKLKEMEAEMSRFEEEISGNFNLFGGGDETRILPPPPPPPPPPRPKPMLENPPLRPPPPPPPPQSSGIRLGTPVRPPGTDGPRLPPPPPPPPQRPMPPSGMAPPRFLPPQLRQQPMRPDFRPPDMSAMRPRFMMKPPQPMQMAEPIKERPPAPVIVERPKMIYSAPPQLKKSGSDAEPSTSKTVEATPIQSLPAASLKPVPPKSAHPEPPVASQQADDEMEIEPEAIKQDTLVSLTPQLAKRAGNKKLSSNRHNHNKQPKKNKFLRIAAGQIWEDQSLAEWDPDDFRLFCGDLGNEVNDDVLTRAFSKYASFQKAKVVRDRRTNKSKGYGFVSFRDPTDFTRAVREMNGKYVGNRPIKLRKSQWQDRQIDVVRKKEKEKKKLGLKV